MAERNGISRDRTLFFVRNGSTVASLGDLRGHSIAFRNTTSSGAYFVPAMQLLQEGMTLQRLLSPMDHADGATVGFVLARRGPQHRHVGAPGPVDIGVMGAVDWRRMPAAMRTGFHIVGESAEFPMRWKSRAATSIRACSRGCTMS